MAASGSLRPHGFPCTRRCRGFVIERAGYPNTRTTQPLNLQRRRKVAITRRFTDAGGRILLVSAFNGRQQHGSVGHILRHWPGGVLVGGNGDNAVSVDPANRGFDRRQARIVCRDLDRSRSFGANISRPEVGGGADAGTRATGIEYGSAIVEAPTQVRTRVVGVHAVTAYGVVAVGHTRGDPIWPTR